MGWRAEGGREGIFLNDRCGFLSWLIARASLARRTPPRLAPNPIIFRLGLEGNVEGGGGGAPGRFGRAADASHAGHDGPLHGVAWRGAAVWRYGDTVQKEEQTHKI